MSNVPVHPVQLHDARSGECPQIVTMAAYEVYARVFGEQREMVEGGCRGGFSAGELIAFLYAKGLPPTEWRRRVDEALEGMRHL